jgi:uncharacterized protein YxeA
MKKLAVLIVAIVTAIAGLFAWKRQKADDALDYAVDALRPGTDKPGIDETWLHEQRAAERP